MKTLALFLPLLFLPFLGHAEPKSAQGGINFRIVIPEVLELRQNIHPQTAQTDTVQRLLIQSNSRSTCVQVTAPGNLEGWRVNSTTPQWYKIPTAQGANFCTNAQGNLDLVLQHTFNQPLSYWPIQVTVLGRT